LDEKEQNKKKKPSKTAIAKRDLKKRGKRMQRLRTALHSTRMERMQRESEIMASDEYRINQLAKEQKFEKERWYKLDNSGSLYPAMYQKGYNPNFTLTVVLKDKIAPLTLQQAVNDVAPRFAPMTAALKRGVFWAYLGVPKPVAVQRGSSANNYKSLVDGRTSMSRIFYTDYEISLSVFHAASDASGATVFLNSVLNRYFELCGIEITDRTNRLSYKDKIQPEEVEDSYQKVADNVKRERDDEKKTYQIKGTKLPKDILRIIKGTCLASQANEIAKKHGLTLTHLFNAVLLFAIQKEKDFYRDDSAEPITVCSAVNLRNFFPSTTLRNFASYVSTTPNGETTLEGLFNAVKQQYETKLNKDYFLARVNFNVKSQRNFFVKIAPLPLKNFILGIGYNILGKKARTVTLSNLGRIKAPKEFNSLVERYEFHLGDSAPMATACAVASFNDILCVTFTRIIEESLVEKEFFRCLSDLGIEFAVESNLE
jgi:hypothetical protein